MVSALEFGYVFTIGHVTNVALFTPGGAVVRVRAHEHAFALVVEDDFVQILTEPENALLKQYAAMFTSEGVELAFDDDAVREIAKTAARVNDEVENIGARRLQTVMERVLDDISFEAPDKGGEQYKVDADYVHKALDGIAGNVDLSRYIL